MIEPQILYGVTCDRCGDTLINSNDNSAWYDRSTAEEEASEEDWHSVRIRRMYACSQTERNAHLQME